jgi:membrane protein implicated in regulation of membrane protease activity
MIVLALILIIAAVLVAIGVLINADGSATLEAFGVSLSTNEGGLFIAGAATMLVLLLGLALLAAGMKRAKNRRSEVKHLRKDRDSEVQRLQEEKAQLEERVRRERDTPPASSHDDGSVARDRAVPGGTSDSIDLTQSEHRSQHR